MPWTERHHSKYTAERLFDLVADVERCPEFLSRIQSARVFRRKDTTVWTRLTFGMSLVRKNFTTTALLDKPHQISASSYDSLFERFEQLWTLRSASQHQVRVSPNSTVLDRR